MNKTRIRTLLRVEQKLTGKDYVPKKRRRRIKKNFLQKRELD